MAAKKTNSQNALTNSQKYQQIISISLHYILIRQAAICKAYSSPSPTGRGKSRLGGEEGGAICHYNAPQHLTHTPLLYHRKYHK